MNSQTLQLSQLYAIFLFISIHKMWTNPADYYNIVNHSSNVRVQTPNKHFCACPKKSHWESCGGGTASIISGTHQNIPQPHVVSFNHTETSKPPNHMRAPVNFQEIAFSLLCLLNPQRRSVNTGSKKRKKPKNSVLNQHESPSHPLWTKCSLLSNRFDLTCKTQRNSVGDTWAPRHKQQQVNQQF